MDLKFSILKLGEGALLVAQQDFDKMLTKTIKCMQEKKSMCADVNLKLKIELWKPYDEPEEDSDKKILPKFTHKVSSAIQIKDEVSGIFNGVAQDCELVYNESTDEYIVRSTNRQLDFFDGE